MLSNWTSKTLEFFQLQLAEMILNDFLHIECQMNGHQSIQYSIDLPAIIDKWMRGFVISCIICSIFPHSNSISSNKSSVFWYSESKFIHSNNLQLGAIKLTSMPCKTVIDLENDYWFWVWPGYSNVIQSLLAFDLIRMSIDLAIACIIGNNIIKLRLFNDSSTFDRLRLPPFRSRYVCLECFKEKVHWKYSTVHIAVNSFTFYENRIISCITSVRWLFLSFLLVSNKLEIFARSTKIRK